MKNLVPNEKGIALITTLMLMVLGSGVIATLLYTVLYGTKITRLGQQYTIALDAAKGGADLIINMMQNEVYGPPALAGAVAASSTACMEQKLTQATFDSDPSASWPSCCAYAANTADCNQDMWNSNPTVRPDLTLTLANYQVFVKVINTRKTGSKFLYKVNVRAQDPTGQSRADISFLYSLSVLPP